MEKGKNIIHLIPMRRIKFEGNYLNGKKWNGIGFNFIGKPDFEIKDGNGIIKEYHYIN